MVVVLALVVMPRPRVVLALWLLSSLANGLVPRQAPVRSTAAPVRSAAAPPLRALQRLGGFAERAADDADDEAEDTADARQRRKRRYINLTGFPFPLAPLFERRTVRREVGRGIWSFEQEQGLFGINANVRMVVVRLDDGSLWVHNPVAPTDECIELLRELDAPVKCAHRRRRARMHRRSTFVPPAPRAAPASSAPRRRRGSLPASPLPAPAAREARPTTPPPRRDATRPPDGVRCPTARLSARSATTTMTRHDATPPPDDVARRPPPPRAGTSCLARRSTSTRSSWRRSRAACPRRTCASRAFFFIRLVVLSLSLSSLAPSGGDATPPTGRAAVVLWVQTKPNARA